MISPGRKLYLPESVWTATQERLRWLFAEFENVFVSFSGGKDSGVLLNLCLDYLRRHAPHRTIGVFHQDFEAQYTETTGYVERTLTRGLDLIRPYWLCLPMSCKTATSMYEQYWTPWDPEAREIWVRPRPDYSGVIHLDNLAEHHLDFYRPGMLQDDLYDGFAPWYHRQVAGGKGRTVCLVGLRSDESLNRWRAVTARKESAFQGVSWTTGIADGTWAAYPLYDWRTEDIWTSNAREGWDYNRLYDLFHLAGVPLHDMRVASPFNDWAISSLKLYRAVEPAVWARMVGRVNGANFSALYGGTEMVGWKRISLPAGHTWKSFLDLLLRTLPEETRATYEQKFATSIEFWRTRGGCLSPETIAELRALGIPIEIRGKTAYRTDKQAVTFAEYPDDCAVAEFQSCPSYKRMCICILKNDHLCKFMGFSQTQEESKRRQAALAKYRDL